MDSSSPVCWVPPNAPRGTTHPPAYACIYDLITIAVHGLTLMPPLSALLGAPSIELGTQRGDQAGLAAFPLRSARACPMPFARRTSKCSQRCECAVGVGPHASLDQNALHVFWRHT